MILSPGQIHSVDLPDIYSNDVPSVDLFPGNLRSMTVLILSAKKKAGDIICLPLFEYANATENAYIPCGDRWMLDPHFLTEVSKETNFKFIKNVPPDKQSEILRFLKEYYTGLILKNCIHTYQAFVPYSSTGIPESSGKNRPVVYMGASLYFPMTTNRGSYDAPNGVLVSSGGGGKVGFCLNTPIHLPESFVIKKTRQTLQSQDKKGIISNHSKLDWLCDVEN